MRGPVRLGRGGGLSASTIANYLAESADTRTQPAYDVGSWTTFDANLTYAFEWNGGPLANTSLGFAATNLFDQDPPRTRETTAYLGIPYDSTNVSVIGRFVSVTLKKRF